MLLEQQLKTVERVLEMRIIPQVQIYARIRNHGCHHHHFATYDRKNSWPRRRHSILSLLTWRRQLMGYQGSHEIGDEEGGCE